MCLRFNVLSIDYVHVTNCFYDYDYDYESPLQKRSGMARVLKGFHSFTCTPTHSSAIGMSHTCLCLLSRSWYSFTDPGGMEG